MKVGDCVYFFDGNEIYFSALKRIDSEIACFENKYTGNYMSDIQSVKHIYSTEQEAIDKALFHWKNEIKKHEEKIKQLKIKIKERKIIDLRNEVTE